MVVEYFSSRMYRKLLWVLLLQGAAAVRTIWLPTEVDGKL